MRKFRMRQGVELAIATIALTAVIAQPALAGAGVVPGPPAGVLAGGAIIGALVIAKWWRRK